LKANNINIVTGLGNPGFKYSNTPHNIGFLAVDEFTDRIGKPLYRKKTLSYFRSDYFFNGSEIITIKPLMYMNNSGQALKRVNINWVRQIKGMLIVYDDVALEFGQLRIREAGSAGGHNGLKDIINNFQTDQIARLRIGIGGAPEGRMLKDHVLGSFNKEQRKLLPYVISRAADAIESIILNGLTDSMNLYNRKFEY